MMPEMKNKKLKISIETYGCTMNQADSDILRGIVSKKHLITGTDEAEITILNTCGVVDFTERKILKRAKELKIRGKKVILTGCLPKIAPKKVKKVVDVAIGTNVDEINKAIKNATLNQKFFSIKRPKFDKSELHTIKIRKRENAIAIVSISEGCLGKCTFCATRFARGRLKSFELENIVKEVKGVVEEGFKEIQLTSQDTGVYGMDKNYNLPNLLNAISEIERDFRVRVGMMNPTHALNMLDELIDSFKSKKVYKFLHIPVQSGDNQIIRDMGRDYSVEDFEHIINEFRNSFDDVMISTDIIVGFPTETKESFEKSYEILKRVKPDLVNITRYSPRKGTPSYKKYDMADWIKKEWSRKLTALCREININRNKKFVNSIHEVLVTKKGKNDTFLSRNSAYRPIVLQNVEIGHFYKVKVINSSENYLKAKVL